MRAMLGFKTAPSPLVAEIRNPEVQNWHPDRHNRQCRASRRSASLSAPSSDMGLSKAQRASRRNGCKPTGRAGTLAPTSPTIPDSDLISVISISSSSSSSSSSSDGEGFFDPAAGLVNPELAALQAEEEALFNASVEEQARAAVVAWRSLLAGEQAITSTRVAKYKGNSERTKARNKARGVASVKSGTASVSSLFQRCVLRQPPLAC
jgi:hypothetical protein